MGAKQGGMIVAVSLLLLTAILWGGMYPVAKSVLLTIDAFYMSVIRYVLACIIYIIVLIIVEGFSALRLEGKGWSLFWRGSVGFVGFGIITYMGLSFSTPVHGAVIIALMPLITIIITWITSGKKPDNITLACVVAAFIGVLLVITRGHFATLLAGGRGAFGDLLMVIGTICWVIYTLGLARLPKWSGLRYTALTTVGGAISIIIITAIVTLIGYIHLPTLADIASVKFGLGYVVIGATIIATLAWNFGIQKIGAVNGVLFINFIPITTFVIELFRGERFPAIEYIGAGIVILALIVNYFNMRRTLRNAKS